ncbi:hypothetical protein [Streptomyces sp. 891-h]|uniref:hypothetical protein n=1 Tax=Streptomyces sp. 891-h TaxID=2720714 RepID=UPI001FA9DB3A|nr:hypothetical protein [Streptomyces sp. 891-h]UNZ20008.1 hypothetical protein HC362_26125 [Streptomyces sp. 891-h]
MFAVLALVAGVVMLKTDYLDARSVLDDGRPGVFTLDRCERAGGSGTGPSTFCYGDFRSRDGKVELEHLRLPEEHDAAGMKPGETFPAHAVEHESGPDEVIRSDDKGRADLTARAVGASGMVLLGFMLVGFAVRATLEAGSKRHSRLGAWCGFGTVVSLLLWFIGRGTGGGFWA